VDRSLFFCFLNVNIISIEQNFQIFMTILEGLDIEVSM